MGVREQKGKGVKEGRKGRMEVKKGMVLRRRKTRRNE